MLTLKSAKLHPVFLIIVVTAIILFIASSVRHALFYSTAFDLAIFDQAIYLISQNQTPFSSLMAINILGDHAAFIFYPLALLYKIYPDVHWLLLVQAVSLALGAWPSLKKSAISMIIRNEDLITSTPPTVFSLLGATR